MSAFHSPTHVLLAPSFSEAHPPPKTAESCVNHSDPHGIIGPVSGGETERNREWWPFGWHWGDLRTQFPGHRHLRPRQSSVPDWRPPLPLIPRSVGRLVNAGHPFSKTISVRLPAAAGFYALGIAMPINYGPIASSSCGCMLPSHRPLSDGSFHQGHHRNKGRKPSTTDVTRGADMWPADWELFHRGFPHAKIQWFPFKQASHGGRG